MGDRLNGSTLSPSPSSPVRSKSKRSAVLRQLAPFVGRWEPDTKRCESLEDMLKVMGVNFLLRKLALSLKEHIDVSIDVGKDTGVVEMKIVNRTNVTETSDTHLVNGEVRTIATKKGSISTMCTFDPDLEFPLCITANISKERPLTSGKSKRMGQRWCSVYHSRPAARMQ